jgi:hypothetical protein
MHWLYFDGFIMCCETGNYFALNRTKVTHYITNIILGNEGFEDFSASACGRIMHEEEFATEAFAKEKFEHLKDFLKARTL